MSEAKPDMLDFSSKKKKKTNVPAATESAKSDLPDFGAKKPKAKVVPVESTKSTVAEPELPDFGTKKKKKPKTTLPAEAPDSPSTTDLPEFGKKKSSKTVTIDTGAVDKVADQLDDLSFMGKKKKQKQTIDEADLTVSVGEDGTATAEGVTETTPSSYGYSYETLLARVFAQIQANNPELISDQKRRLVMAPPCMARVGTKKTQFTNFSAICRSLNRKADHLSAYMFAELGTTGSLDANGALLIKGKYQSKHIEPVLRNYARTYVLCSTCQSPETDLSRDSRLLFLQCRRCGSRVTVKTVTSGFQAVTGKRAAIRAKAQ